MRLSIHIDGNYLSRMSRKLSRTVLRGEGGSNSADLLDVNTEERTAVILNAVLPLTKIFADHKFTLDYILDPVQGQVGRISSVNDLDYYTTGELK